MDIYAAIATRKSIRAFLDREVPEELLLRLSEAARLAPSACNFQEWRFVVVRNPEIRKRLAMAANRQMFISEAPVLIVCYAVTFGLSTRSITSKKNSFSSRKDREVCAMVAPKMIRI